MMLLVIVIVNVYETKRVVVEERCQFFLTWYGMSFTMGRVYITPTGKNKI